MGVVVKIEEGGYRLYVNGASEILTNLCTRHVVVSRNGIAAMDENAPVEMTDIDTDAKENISRTIIFYANQTLRTIAICYRNFSSWPPANVTLTDGEVRSIVYSSDLYL